MAIIAVGIVIAFLVVILVNLGGFVSQIMGTILYNLAVPIMHLLDFVQVLFRKLAGLDTVYTRNNSSIFGGYNPAESGDILLTLITHNTVKQVFLAMLIVSVAILIIATIIQMIRTEYTTEGSRNSKTAILGTALKAFAYFFITPVLCGFGIVLANFLLQALDAATAQAGANTISGSVFLAAASDANRVRSNDTSLFYKNIMTTSAKVIVRYDDDAGFQGDFASWETARFGSNIASSSPTEKRENVATNIDNAFTQGSKLTAILGAGNVHTLDDYPEDIFPEGVEGKGIKELWLSYDSPFKVMRYYNLSNINYFILYVGLCMCVVTLFKACFGMIKRMYTATMLFMISPGVIGIWPLDNGAAFNKWRSAFVGSVLSAYGVVLALNLYFDIVGIIKSIYLFDPAQVANNIPYALYGLWPFAWGLAYYANRLVQGIMIVVGALMIGEFSSTISNFIGATDGLKEGSEMSGKVAGAVGKGAMVAMGGGALALKAGKGIAGAVGSGIRNIGSNVKAGYENGQKAGQNRVVSGLRGLGKGFAGIGIGAGKKVASGATKFGATAVGALTGRTSEEVLDNWEDRSSERQSKKAIKTAEKKKQENLNRRKKLYEKKKKEGLTADEQKELETLTHEKINLEQDKIDANQTIKQTSNRRKGRDAVRAGRMGLFNKVADYAPAFMFMNSALGKGLNSATGGLIAGLGGDTTDKLKKFASGKSDAAKEYIEAMDGYNSSVKQAKGADETGRAKATVAAINKLAEQKEISSLAMQSVVSSLASSKVHLSDDDVTKLARALAQGYSGGNFNTDALKSKLGEMNFDGKISEEVTNSMAQKMAEAVKSGLKDLKQKDDKVVAAIEELGEKILNSSKADKK